MEQDVTERQNLLLDLPEVKEGQKRHEMHHIEAVVGHATYVVVY